MGYHNTIYRDISCDIAPDHHETTGKQARNVVVVDCIFWRCLCARLCLYSSGPSFFVVLLSSISGTHHRTDSPTSKTKQHPRPLWAWPTSWAHVCVCFIWSFFPPLILSFSAFVVPIQASYLRGTSYFALNWSRRFGWFLVENNFVVSKWT